MSSASGDGGEHLFARHGRAGGGRGPSRAVEVVLRQCSDATPASARPSSCPARMSVLGASRPRGEASQLSLASSCAAAHCPIAGVGNVVGSSVAALRTTTGPGAVDGPAVIGPNQRARDLIGASPVLPVSLDSGGRSNQGCVWSWPAVLRRRPCQLALVGAVDGRVWFVDVCVAARGPDRRRPLMGREVVRVAPAGRRGLRFTLGTPRERQKMKKEKKKKKLWRGGRCLSNLQGSAPRR